MLNIESIHHELIRTSSFDDSDPFASIFKFAYCFKLVRNNKRIENGVNIMKREIGQK